MVGTLLHRHGRGGGGGGWWLLAELGLVVFILFVMFLLLGIVIVESGCVG